MANDVADPGDTAPESEDEAKFEAQARAVGIVLPKRTARDPWGALVIVVAMIVLAAGVGEVTGWINLRAPSATNGGYETQTCSGYSVRAVGTVSSAIDPAFAGWLEGAGTNLSAAVGGCFSVTVDSDSGDGYLSLFGSSPSEFAATYAPPTSADSEMLANPVAVVPVTLAAVAVVYNLPGVDSGLNLTGAVLAGIFNGSITSWSDPAIVAANPGVALSGLPPIEPTYVSGTDVANQVLSNYLSTASPSWAAEYGSGLRVDWPAGTGVSTDSQVVAAVSAVPGAIGYVQTFGILPNGLGVADLLDSAGNFAAPSAIDCWVAAESYSNSTAVLDGNWTGLAFAGASAPGSYPLTSLAFAGIYQDLGVAYGGAVSLANATWLLTYLYWLTSVPAVAPLPPAYATSVINALNNETYDGTTIVHLDSETGEGGESGGETGEF